MGKRKYIIIAIIIVILGIGLFLCLKAGIKNESLPAEQIEYHPGAWSTEEHYFIPD